MITLKLDYFFSPGYPVYSTKIVAPEDPAGRAGSAGGQPTATVTPTADAAATATAVNEVLARLHCSQSVTATVIY